MDEAAAPEPVAPPAEVLPEDDVPSEPADSDWKLRGWERGIPGSTLLVPIPLFNYYFEFLLFPQQEHAAVSCVQYHIVSLPPHFLLFLGPAALKPSTQLPMQSQARLSLVCFLLPMLPLAHQSLQPNLAARMPKLSFFRKPTDNPARLLASRRLPQRLKREVWRVRQGVGQCSVGRPRHGLQSTNPPLPATSVYPSSNRLRCGCCQHKVTLTSKQARLGANQAKNGCTGLVGKGHVPTNIGNNVLCCNKGLDGEAAARSWTTDERGACGRAGH